MRNYEDWAKFLHLNFATYFAFLKHILRSQKEGCAIIRCDALFGRNQDQFVKFPCQAQHYKENVYNTWTHVSSMADIYHVCTYWLLYTAALSFYI